MPDTAFTLREVAPATPLRVEVVSDIKRFAALRAEWSDLLCASAASCPFLTWEWLHTWWTHLGGARTLNLLTVRSGDQLMGLAPLSFVRGSLPWQSRLEFLGTGFAGSDYLDVIARRPFEAACVGSITEWL